MHPAIPVLVLMLGAGTLTLASYRVAPLTWRISSPFARFGILNIAALLTIGYLAIVPAGERAPIISVPSAMLGAAGIALIGLGAGFLVTGLMLLFRRSQ